MRRALQFLALWAALLGGLFVGDAHAQTFPGQLQANKLLGNCTGSQALTTACALGLGLNNLNSGALNVEPGYARLWPAPGQSTTPTAAWRAVDPWGRPINCAGTNSQCLNEFNAAVYANGWPARVFCQGSQFPGGAEPIYINSTVTIVFPVGQDMDYEVDATCNFNIQITGAASGVTIDSQGASKLWLDGKIVYQPSAPNGNTTTNPSCAVLVNPTTNTADGFAGLYAGRLRIKAPVVAPQVQQAITGAANNGGGLIRLTVASTSGWATNDTKTVTSILGTTEANGTWLITVVDSTHIDLQNSTFAHAYMSGGSVYGVATGAVCFNTATGSTIQMHAIELGELNASNILTGGFAFFGNLVYGAGLTTGFMQNIVTTGQVHGAVQKGTAVGFTGDPHQVNYNGNQWQINNCQMAIVAGSAVSRCLDSFASSDSYQLGPMNNAQGGLTSGVVLESGGSFNTVNYASITGATSVNVIDSGTCNSYSGPQGSQVSYISATGSCTKFLPQNAATGNLEAAFLGFQTGRYITGRAYEAGSSTTLSASANVLYAQPLIMDGSATWTSLSIGVQATGTATACRLGIFNSSNGVPTTLLLDAGTVAVTGTGTQSATISQALPVGWYFGVVVCNGTVTLYGSSPGNNQVSSYHEAIGTAAIGGGIDAQQSKAFTYGVLSGASPWGTSTFTAATVPTIALKM